MNGFHYILKVIRRSKNIPGQVTSLRGCLQLRYEAGCLKKKQINCLLTTYIKGDSIERNSNYIYMTTLCLHKITYTLISALFLYSSNVLFVHYSSSSKCLYLRFLLKSKSLVERHHPCSLPTPHLGGRAG